MKKITLFLLILLAGCSVSASGKNESFSIIAHRGDNQYAPEHTLLAYKKAVKLGADYIEIDLRWSKDGQLVSIHDEKVDRTTDGKGKVADFTLLELKELNVGTKQYPQEILTLEEIVKYFESSTNYYIEIRDKEMVKPLLNILTKNNLLDKAIIQSYSKERLLEIRKYDNDVPLVQLFINLDNFDILSVSQYANGIGLDASMVDKELVDKAHKYGLFVHPFFYDKSTEQKLIKKLISYGVDGVFTDHLESTVKLMDY